MDREDDRRLLAPTLASAQPHASPIQRSPGWETAPPLLAACPRGRLAGGDVDVDVGAQRSKPAEEKTSKSWIWIITQTAFHCGPI
ncbi:unnamed protein product [Boreogadus saida]